MKNSEKFWCSILLMFLWILLVNYFDEFIEIFTHILLIILFCFILSYFLFGIVCIIISLLDDSPLDDNHINQYIAYKLGVKYNIIYFVFYTCIIKFNNFLNNKL